MKYLLDTHILIWYIENSPKLHKKHEIIIDDDENGIFVSAVTYWEIALKISLGKLKMSLSFKDFVENIEKRKFTILQIKNDYLECLLKMPFIHRDPFDRMIVSTATVEKLSIITMDENIMKYGIPFI
ncbi:MAG: type II toxin-antitoxin system VapC family toxin [Defluviitaleaceae bacterium]|nr:type II toxin-antitoxin system VapC family toxin [Defluviitaleaceae bacterium]